ncbi:MAG: hypothetical protein WCK58_07930 [Chloroflexota bacterium]
MASGPGDASAVMVTAGWYLVVFANPGNPIAVHLLDTPIARQAPTILERPAPRVVRLGGLGCAALPL